jgi:hypothetical protein
LADRTVCLNTEVTPVDPQRREAGEVTLGQEAEHLLGK